MFSPSDQRKQHSIPSMAYIRLNYLLWPTFIILLKLLKDDIAKLLELYWIIWRKLTKDLPWIHTGWLVEMAPMLRTSQGTLKLVGARSSDSNFFGKCPFPWLMNKPCSKRITILNQDQKPLRPYFSVEGFEIDSNKLRSYLI